MSCFCEPPQATKSNLSNSLQAQPYQLIHIVTHSIANFKNPKLSVITCFSYTEDETPLFFANEIPELDIEADLVVLRSCESGIG